MRTVILILAAIVLVASGVAAVSAYEAHVVNVKATVENALYVTTNETDFGTVFPEEWLSDHFDVEFSGSWYDQERKDTVDFEVWAEWKLKDDMGTDNADDDVYYPWLGNAMYIQFDGIHGYIGDPPTGPPGAKPATDENDDPIVGTLSGNNTSMTVYLWLDVPVFFDFYNPLTDVPDKPRAEWADNVSGIDKGDPSMILPTGTPQGYEMGLDIKIQVVDIKKVN
jgi:hypothetical protein